MKATGIVRRIDDLGRVVIPKEIRRTLRIKEGESLEIFTDGTGGVVLKKYSPLGELGSSAEAMCDVISRQCKAPVLVCDGDGCIAASGVPKREVLGRNISTQLQALCRDRKNYVCTGSEPLYPLQECSLRAAAASPVLASGDVLGCVCALAAEDGSADMAAVQRAVSLSAMLFGSWLQE